MKQSRIQQCYGATMIEVLISLFVLAIGLLGVLGMQAEGTQANQRGLFSTQAAFLAQNMADRIRTNPTGDYNNTDTEDGYAVGTDCAAANCGIAALRDFDRAEWETDLEAQLPDARGVVNFADPMYTITVIWSERSSRAEGISNDCGGLDIEDGLACYQLEMRP
ncbi:type IV pilus modification protein PilV [Porticoccus sp. W117]|uniref:type IV pilus modification protein PilV n=1 Tax=Porticoccus sp. W117 TaxID=3054777 RepID=UPI0025945118|nr:type IV pilus modification protein PilV [Porticoccus sp. W117]MDM3871261.1 type IV pilus modification protein PilV [Porticoccus sp. W117]